MSENADHSDAEQWLEAHGFKKLAAQFADEAVRAKAAAEAMTGRMPDNQDPALEPATVYLPIGPGGGADDD